MHEVAEALGKPRFSCDVWLLITVTKSSSYFVSMYERTLNGYYPQGRSPQLYARDEHPLMLVAGHGGNLKMARRRIYGNGGVDYKGSTCSGGKSNELG